MKLRVALILAGLAASQSRAAAAPPADAPNVVGSGSYRFAYPTKG